jgi:hypothetical protein
MSSNLPDPTDAAWSAAFASWETQPFTDSSSVGGMGGAPQPPFDPDEPWIQLPPLTRVPAGAVFDLVQELRAAGVPVTGSPPRRSGLFSRGAVDVTLSVPTRLRDQAETIVRRTLGQ